MKYNNKKRENLSIEIGEKIIIMIKKG